MERRSSPREPGSGWQPRIEPAELVPLAIVVGVALVLRLAGLGRESLWIDEIWSLWTAEGDLTHLVTMVRIDVHPPLYYLLLHVWISMAGIGEVALRLPSALLSTGAVAMTWAVGRILVGRWAALVAAAVLAVSPFQLQYAQEARSYALLLVLALVSMRFLLAVMIRSTSRRRLGWLATTSMLLYCHYAGLVFLACQNLLVTVACIGDRRNRTRRSRHLIHPSHWLALQLACLVLFMPGLVLLLEQKFGVPADFWLPPLSWSAMVELFRLVVGIGAPPGVSEARWSAAAAAGGLALLGLTALGASRHGRLLLEPATDERLEPVGDDVLPSWLRSWALGVWLVGPPVVVAVLSVVGVELFTVRNLLFVAPAFALTVAALAARVTQPSLRTLVVALLIAAPAANLPAYFASVRKEQWRAAGAAARELWQDGDAVVADAWFGQRAFEYYLGQRVQPIDPFTVPLDGIDRVWLVRSHSRDPSRLIPRALVAKGLQPLLSRHFLGVSLELYRRGPPEGARGGPQPPPEVRVVVRPRTDPPPGFGSP